MVGMGRRSDAAPKIQKTEGFMNPKILLGLTFRILAIFEKRGIFKKLSNAPRTCHNFEVCKK